MRESAHGEQADITLRTLLATVASSAETPRQWYAATAESITLSTIRQQLQERGLPGADIPPPGTIEADMTIAEACRSIWYAQLLAMLLCEAGVRTRNEIEYVHDMRVATRRARVAATMYGQYFRRKAIRRLTKGLRKTGKQLGKVRDLDVAIDGLERKAAKEGKLSATDAQLLDEWRTARAEAHDRLLAWLDSDTYATFLANSLAFCRTPGAGAKSFVHRPASTPDPHHVADVVPTMLMQRFATIRSYQRLWVNEASVDYATIHLLRIDCKYLRYNLEFYAHLLGNNATTLIKRLKHLQDVLGELNDAVVGEAMLVRRQKDAEASQAADLARKLERQRSLISRLEADVPQELATFTAKDTRKRLTSAIARL